MKRILFLIAILIVTTSISVATTEIKAECNGALEKARKHQVTRYIGELNLCVQDIETYRKYMEYQTENLKHETISRYIKKGNK